MPQPLIRSEGHRFGFRACPVLLAALVAPVSAAPVQAPGLSAPIPLQVAGEPLQVESPGHASPCWFDITRDGKPDLVVGQHARGAVFFFAAKGKGAFAKARPVQIKGKPLQIPGVSDVPSDYGATVHLADIDGDMRVDMIAGSYMDVAGGTLRGQIYWMRGKGKGFTAPKVLEGDAGKPLSMGTGDATPLARTASAPTTVDIDGDGKLDLVCGNFEGAFYLFKGLGKGRFEQQATALQGPEGPIKVTINSSPAFVDWDGDGDQDLLSGSGIGGVYLFTNTGTPKAPSFGESVTLVETPKPALVPPLGLTKLQGPGTHTRVWAGDRNGDGKPDLLVGDKTTVAVPARGVSDERAIQAFEDFNTQLAELAGSAPAPGADPSASVKWVAKVQALEKTRDELVHKVETGLVWELFRQ